MEKGKFPHKICKVAYPFPDLNSSKCPKHEWDFFRNGGSTLKSTLKTDDYRILRPNH